MSVSTRSPDMPFDHRDRSSPVGEDDVDEHLAPLDWTALLSGQEDQLIHSDIVEPSTAPANGPTHSIRLAPNPSPNQTTGSSMLSTSSRRKRSRQSSSSSIDRPLHQRLRRPASHLPSPDVESTAFEVRSQSEVQSMHGPSPFDNLDEPVHPDDEAEIWATHPPSDRRREPSPPSLPHQASQESVSSANSDSSVPVEIDPDTGNRRFTTQEKGKGRAAQAPVKVRDLDGEEELDIDDMYDDDSFEIVEVRPAGEKRKSVEDVESDDEVEVEDQIAEEEGVGLAVEEHGIGSFSELGSSVDGPQLTLSTACPICFCAPEQAVMTDW